MEGLLRDLFSIPTETFSGRLKMEGLLIPGQYSNWYPRAAVGKKPSSTASAMVVMGSLSIPSRSWMHRETSTVRPIAAELMVMERFLKLPHNWLTVIEI